MSQLKSFEELECWKACTELRKFIVELLKKFPPEEKYILVSQIKRCARSITNNIAEGYGRFHFKENAQFCRQSRGSIYELKDHMIISLDESYITVEDYNQFIELFNRAVPILNGYINYLIKSLDKPINV
ncbi:MAG: four helix bundle protein [Chitinophagaceae bacterium]